MSSRQVTRTGKDADGDITCLCNPTQFWSRRAKADAISDIENNIHAYYVLSSYGRVEIHVAQGKNGKYLRTDNDDKTVNNLDNLPDC